MQRENLTRKEQAEKTKKALFESALMLLEQQDYETIKVRDIVRAANVSIGSFYNYYTTKLDVYYETYVLADRFFEETVAPLLTQPTLRERLLFFFDYYARYSSEITSIKLTKLLYNSENKCFNRRSEIGMRPVLIRTLQWGIEQGALRQGSDTAEEIASFLMNAVHGLVYGWCIEDGAFDLRQAMAHYVDTLLRCFL